MKQYILCLLAKISGIIISFLPGVALTVSVKRKVMVSILGEAKESVRILIRNVDRQKVFRVLIKSSLCLLGKALCAHLEIPIIFYLFFIWGFIAHCAPEDRSTVGKYTPGTGKTRQNLTGNLGFREINGQFHKRSVWENLIGDPLPVMAKLKAIPPTDVRRLLLRIWRTVHYFTQIQQGARPNLPRPNRTYNYLNMIHPNAMAVLIVVLNKKLNLQLSGNPEENEEPVLNLEPEAKKELIALLDNILIEAKHSEAAFGFLVRNLAEAVPTEGMSEKVKLPAESEPLADKAFSLLQQYAALEIQDQATLASFFKHHTMCEISESAQPLSYFYSRLFQWLPATPTILFPDLFPED